MFAFHLLARSEESERIWAWCTASLVLFTSACEWGSSVTNDVIEVISLFQSPSMYDSDEPVAED